MENVAVNLFNGVIRERAVDLGGPLFVRTVVAWLATSSRSADTCRRPTETLRTCSCDASQLNGDTNKQRALCACEGKGLSLLAFLLWSKLEKV